MKTTRYKRAFTLVELLVTLVVTNVILLAVTTLAFALSNATRASDDTVFKEAQLRQARLRLGELIRNGKLICAAPGNDLVVWRDDPNDDGAMSVDELVYIERGDNLDTLRLCEFASTDGATVTLASLALTTTKDQLISQYTEKYATLIPVCQNVQFHLDADPPSTRRVAVSFDLEVNRGTHPYEIDMALRGSGANLLSADGTALVGDDD